MKEKREGFAKGSYEGTVVCKDLEEFGEMVRRGERREPRCVFWF